MLCRALIAGGSYIPYMYGIYTVYVRYIYSIYISILYTVYIQYVLLCSALIASGSNDGGLPNDFIGAA